MNEELEEEFEKIAAAQAALNYYTETVAPTEGSLFFSVDWVKKNILQINDDEG